MPELPFLQVLAENVDSRLRGRTITAARLYSVSLLRTIDPPLSALEDRRVIAARRVAKLIVLDAGELSLVLHLMRDGRLQIGAPRARPGKDLALGLRLDGGEELRLVELGPKKRASAYVVPTAALFEREPARGLGVDPFATDLRPGRLHEMLRSEPVQLKRFLTLQRYVTGIGNAYSDEILHMAKLSPVKLTTKLDDDEIERLHAACKRGLEQWTQRLREHHGEAFPEQVTAFHPDMAVHGKYGQPCPVCGDLVQRIVYASRETNYCPTCQTEGKLLADRALSRLLAKDWPKSLEELESYKAARRER